MSRLQVKLRGTLLADIHLENERTYVAGRNPDCDILLEPEKGISREHFKLSLVEKNWQVEVIARFGDILNQGARVKSLTLQHGSQFSVPPYEFQFLETQAEAFKPNSSKSSLNGSTPGAGPSSGSNPQGGPRTSVSPTTELQSMQNFSPLGENGYPIEAGSAESSPMAPFGNGENGNGFSPGGFGESSAENGHSQDAAMGGTGHAPARVDTAAIEKTVAGVSPSVPYIKVMGKDGQPKEMLRLEGGNTWVAGRDSSCSVQIRDARVSRRQFELRKINGNYFVVDLGSANGTLVNGTLTVANEPTPVRSGDSILVLDNHFYFELHDPGFKHRLELAYVPPPVTPAEPEENISPLANLGISLDDLHAPAIDMGAISDLLPNVPSHPLSQNDSQAQNFSPSQNSQDQRGNDGGVKTDDYGNQSSENRAEKNDVAGKPDQIMEVVSEDFHPGMNEHVQANPYDPHQIQNAPQVYVPSQGGGFSSGGGAGGGYNPSGSYNPGAGFNPAGNPYQTYQSQQAFGGPGSPFQQAPISSELPPDLRKKKTLRLVLLFFVAALVGYGVWEEIAKSKLGGPGGKAANSGAGSGDFKPLTAIDSLSPAEKSQIEEYYKQADNLCTQEKYHECKLRVDSIHAILPDGYKDSKRFLAEALSYIDAEEFQRKEDERLKATAEEKAEIDRIVKGCRKLINPKVTVVEIESCLTEADRRNPTDPAIAALKTEASNIESSRKLKEEENERYNAQAGILERKFKDAEEVNKSGQAMKTIEAYKKVVKTVDLPDPKGFRAKAASRIKTIEEIIESKTHERFVEAEKNYKEGQLKEAISSLREAQLYDPNNRMIKDKIELYITDLTAQLRQVYTEAMLEEHFGNIEGSEGRPGAVDKLDEIVRRDIKDGEYYRKAMSKLLNLQRRKPSAN